MTINEFLYYASGALEGERREISKGDMLRHFAMNTSMTWRDKLDCHLAVMEHNWLVWNGT